MIIDEKSDLAQRVSHSPLVYLHPDTNTIWISGFMDQIMEERMDFCNHVEYRRDLRSLGAELFGPLNPINSLLQPLGVRMEKDKIAFRYVDFIAFEVLYFLGFHYSKFNVAMTWLSKLPSITRKDYKNLCTLLQMRRVGSVDKV